MKKPIFWLDVQQNMSEKEQIKKWHNYGQSRYCVCQLSYAVVTNNTKSHWFTTTKDYYLFWLNSSCLPVYQFQILFALEFADYMLALILKLLGGIPWKSSG